MSNIELCLEYVCRPIFPTVGDPVSDSSFLTIIEGLIHIGFCFAHYVFKEVRY
jgi:hypothetical protein